MFKGKEWWKMPIGILTLAGLLLAGGKQIADSRYVSIDDARAAHSAQGQALADHASRVSHPIGELRIQNLEKNVDAIVKEMRAILINSIRTAERVGVPTRHIERAEE